MWLQMKSEWLTFEPSWKTGDELEKGSIPMIIHTRAYARIGFMGNPSDGYFGKTIASAITNFSATVTLWESPTLHIIPHPTHDPTTFDGLVELYSMAKSIGYEGGLRLVLASCKKFQEYCDNHGIELPRRNFTLSYDTDIPRQVGLGGSSAIITAIIRALMQFYELGEDVISNAEIANLVLSAEREELNIPAGLQDRVIQAYEGTIYMDFDQELMETQGYGRYEPMDSSLLPDLFLAYVREPTESGKIHSDVRFRYESGESEVVEAMQTFARYTDEAKEALEHHDHDTVGKLMSANFELRRKIFGDSVLGESNLEMIEIARQMGVPAKFPGSGGAIFGMYQTWEQLQRLARVYRERGFEFVKLSIDLGY